MTVQIIQNLAFEKLDEFLGCTVSRKHSICDYTLEYCSDNVVHKF